MIATTLVVAAALAGCPIADAQAPRDFAYRLSIDAPGDAPFHRIDVPAAVYAGAVRGDLGDLRIFNADGTPVPLAFLPPPGEVREPVAPVELALVPLKIDGRTGDLRDFAIDVRRDAGGTSVQLRGADGNAVTGSRVAGYLVDAGEHDVTRHRIDRALRVDSPGDRGG